ncbi:diguanylate cyclase [Aurantimonas sp. A2-1-M11]|uniref:diguanylate cyclase domain-containing protein n=1 Tax=Aurantimonas sp. A2-1-M11 TaxID=3113712 RepID=UPI002F956C47
MIFRANSPARVSRLTAELEAKSRLIRQQAAMLAHVTKIFDRASEVARIGVWECALPEQTLRWTDVVYDLFELPRGSPLDRDTILQYYPEESRLILEEIRSEAIAARGGFELDVEITTATGRLRWIRITATVECEQGMPVRIFGMKQDITEEKLLADRMRYLAEYDVMTGLANRSQFQTRLELAGAGTDAGTVGALILIDLDGFKETNDTFGHAFGDACLKETAARLQQVCGQAELVARIGGDEFGVILGGHVERITVEVLAATIVDVLNRPFADSVASDLGASVGIALAEPGTEPDILFRRADSALYAAKAAGRQTYRLFSPTMQDPLRSHAA